MSSQEAKKNFYICEWLKKKSKEQYCMKYYSQYEEYKKLYEIPILMSMYKVLLEHSQFHPLTYSLMDAITLQQQT